MTETPAVYTASPIPATTEWQTMKQMAEELHKSGFMPDSVKTPMQALAVIQQGRELGLPPMFSLRNIFIIGGKPSLNMQAMAAIIKQRIHPDAITVEKTTNDLCTVSYWRPTWKERRQFTFTMEDAKRAGLLEGANAHTWRKYPRNMLQARAVSGVAIMEYQDVLGGMYTPEELGAPVHVDPDGTISVTEPSMNPAGDLSRLHAATTPHESEPDARRDMARDQHRDPREEHLALVAHYQELVEAMHEAGLQVPGPLPSPISNKALRELNERLSTSLARKRPAAEAAADAEAEQMALASLPAQAGDREARP